VVQTIWPKNKILSPKLPEKIKKGWRHDSSGSACFSSTKTGVQTPVLPKIK
jgi:hypothetical protein